MLPPLVVRAWSVMPPGNDNDDGGQARKDALGRRLGRLKLMVDKAREDPDGVPSVVLETEMALIAKGLEAVSPAELIAVVESFERYVQEAVERIEQTPFPDPMDGNGV